MTKVVLLLTALAVAAFATTWVGLANGWGSTPCGVRSMTIDGPSDTFSATFVGDTMLGDAATPLLGSAGYDWAFAGVKTLLDTDFVMANAEGPITTLSEPFDPAQHWHYNAQPVAAPAMAAAGIDVIGLANNHAMDRGPDGLEDTIEAATSAGMVTVGAGPSICEAELPVLVHTPAGTLGIVALGKYYGRDKMATAIGPGTVALSQASIRRGAELARAGGADWIVAFVHWGRSYEDVTAEQRAFAVNFEEEGYDLVVGMHPHVVQQIGAVEDMPVAYSIGNFVFGAPGRFTEEMPGVGVILRADFGADGLTQVTTRCIATDNDSVGFQPHACNTTRSRVVLGSLNPAMTMKGPHRAALTITPSTEP
jgi:poly-gamma-glutamate synthesis protein (capsule biosynthesis protein)